MIIIYGLSATVSLLILITFLILYDNKVSSIYALIFSLVMICNMGYIWLLNSTSLQEALLANLICYTGGCFMPYLILLLVCKICEIKQKLWMVLIEFAICMFSFYIVATSGKNKMNYISVSLDTSGKYAKLVKEYGALHSFYTISMVLFMTITFAVIIRSYLTKREVSFRTAIMLASICLIDV